MVEKKMQAVDTNKPEWEELRNKAEQEDRIGHTKAALGLIQQYVLQCRGVYGESDDRTLDATRDMIWILDQLGREKEILSTYQNMLAVCEDAFGEEDKRTLEAMSNVSDSLRKMRRDREATALSLRVLSIRKGIIHRYLNDIEHLNKDQLNHIFDIARDMQFHSIWDLPMEEDEKIREDVLAVQRDISVIFEKLLCMEDEQNFDVLDDMAWSYVLNERKEDGIAMRKAILKARKKLCGKDDARTIESMEDLARDVERDLHLPEEARPIREQLLAIRKKQMQEFRQAYGPNDPKTLDAMEMVGDAWEALGNKKMAAKVREEIYDLCRTTYGEDGEKTIAALQRFVETLDRGERHAEARKRRAVLLDMYRNQKDRAIQNGDNEATIDAMNSMTWLLRELHRPAQEEKVRNEMLEMCIKEFGTEDDYTVSVAQMLAFLLYQRKKYEDELALWKRIVIWKKKAGCEESDYVIGAMLEIEKAMLKLGRVGEALSVAKELLGIRKKNLGENHWDTIFARHNVVYILALAGEYAKALAMQEKTMRILVKNRGENQEDAACVLLLCRMFDVMSRCGMGASEIHRQAMELFGDIHDEYLRLHSKRPHEASHIFASERVLPLLGKLKKKLRKGGYDKELATLSQQEEELKQLAGAGLQ